MSYMQNKSIPISPFAQDSMSSAWTSLSQQWDTSSQTWLSANSGNGHAFTGSGYLWGYISPNSNTWSWATYSVASSSASQEKHGLNYHPSIEYAWVSDQTFINYGSNTSYHRVTSSYGSHSALKSSRVNVIRIEP